MLVTFKVISDYTDLCFIFECIIIRLNLDFHCLNIRNIVGAAEKATTPVTLQFEAHEVEKEK